ncbi:MAG: MoxR family ATPase [Clostridia bacterium]|nr:MoxR family ATPase [Clostridia bacterium]
MNEEKTRTEAQALPETQKKIADVIAEIEKVIVGKRPEIVLLLSALLSGSHVLIEDVPGTGKTTLAATLAKVTGLVFKRAQFTPDVMASDITGYNIYNRQKEEFEFRQGLVMCNLMLADEINRASPKTQSALLEAMEENRVTVDGVTYDVPDPFMVIATQNPTGYVGTYPLPEAQLDRFAVKIRMGYPSPEEEIGIVMARREANPLDTVDNILSADELIALKQAARSVNVDEELYRYIVSLIGATRKHPLLSLGASPRASVALLRIAQSYALVRGRDYLLPEDIASVFRPVVAHRLMLKQDAKLKGRSPEEILSDILRTTEVPYKGKR